MTHTETWTCDNEASMNEKKAELLARNTPGFDDGEGSNRRAWAVRFERVCEEEDGEDREVEFLAEFWFQSPLPEWHPRPEEVQ